MTRGARGLKAWTLDRGGAAAMDFAIVSLPLFLLFFGVAEFGRAIWIEEAMQNTASTVARCMGLSLANCSSSGSYSASATTAYASAVARKWGLSLTSQNMTLSADSSCAGTSGVQITLSYPFSTVATNLMPALASVTLTAQACFPTS